MEDVGRYYLVRLNVPVGVTEMEISGDDDGAKVMISEIPREVYVYDGVVNDTGRLGPTLISMYKKYTVLVHPLPRG